MSQLIEDFAGAWGVRPALDVVEVWRGVVSVMEDEDGHIERRCQPGDDVEDKGEVTTATRAASGSRQHDHSMNFRRECTYRSARHGHSGCDRVEGRIAGHVKAG